MYLEYYGLEQAPFSITPDPHYVFLSERHRDALAHLLYGIRQGGGGGFVQLTGEVGTGKTTLSRLLLSQLPENTRVALVLNPRLEPVELLETICEELHLPVPRVGAIPSTAQDTTPPASPSPATTGKPGKASRAERRREHARTSAHTHAPADTPARGPSGKALFDTLSAYLLDAYARGDRVVLIIDEAQNLSAAALEQVRLLTNLETETQKLLQIILIGQPELRDTLARPELRQLAQRITARCHLTPLDEAGTEGYLRHRLLTAGAKRFPFAADAVRRLHQRSGGVPRLINVIAERALLGGYARDLLAIDARTVDQAADETLAPRAASAQGTRTPLLVAGGLALCAIAIAFALSRREAAIPAAAAPVAAHPNTTAQTAVAASPPPLSSAKAPPAPPSMPTSAPVGSGDTATTTTGGGTTAMLDATQLRQRIAALPPDDTREWRRLQALWGASASMDATIACTPAPAPGWRCLRARATLDQLLRLGRPALLKLTVDGVEGWASLLGADTARVTLSLGGEAFAFDRVALAGVWKGEYQTLFPAGADLERAFAANDAAVSAWVAMRLRAHGLALDARRPDPATALRVFETRSGLPGDGRLDAETLFALTSRDRGPRLSSGE